MYKKNERAQQPLLLSDVNNLPQHTRKYLQASWAEVFRREVFLRIPEDRFATLYDKEPSRPNVPVNILVGLEILKEWRGWSDEEMYEHFLFDLQVRYALCCDNFGEGDFDLRTLYYFRKRLNQHAIQTGENLMKVMFEIITDEHIEKFNVNTKVQRMDSSQILSNIADLSRLELLIEAMQRLHRILSKEDQQKYREIFEPYIKEGAGQYTYRIRGKEAVWQHIEQVGIILHDLLGKLASYQEDPVYQIAQRFFEENFKLVEQQVKAKANTEIKPGCLQSVDDVEASYRKKGNHAYKGYVANITETCSKENPLQLITQVQVEPNRVSDNELLKSGVPELKQRTDLEKLVTDGGYTGPSTDQVLRTAGVEQITTGLVGALPSHPSGMLAMSDFDMQLNEAGNLEQVICPNGQKAIITLQRSGHSYLVAFTADGCLTCPFHQNHRCPAKQYQRRNDFAFNLPKDRALSSWRIRRFQSCKEEARALRPAVEATIFQVKHALQRGKVRVRGLFRTACVITCSALAVNLRRIHRYENDQQRGKFTSKKTRDSAFFIFASLIQTCFNPITLFPAISAP
jgi:hypothetical protein